MDPRRPSTVRPRPRACGVALAAIVLGALLVGCHDPDREPIGRAAGADLAAPPEVPHGADALAASASDLVDRLGSARTWRTVQVLSMFVPPVATADPRPSGGRVVFTSRVEASVDRETGVVQGRVATEAHAGADELLGESASLIDRGGIAFEVVLDRRGEGGLLVRLVKGEPLGVPVPSPWRDLEAAADVHDLDEQLVAAEAVLALIDAAVAAAPPEPIGPGSWRGSIPAEIVLAGLPVGGPVPPVTAVVHFVPAELVGGAVRYELADLGGGRARVVLWSDVDDVARRLGEEEVGVGGLTTLEVEWSDLDAPVERWTVRPAPAGP